VCEVSVSDVPSKRASSVRDTRDKDSSQLQRLPDQIEGLQHFVLSQVLEKIGGHDCGQAGSPLSQDLAIVALVDKDQSCSLCDSYLLGTHVDAQSVVAVGEQQPYKISLTTADVDDWPRPRAGQGRADVAPVDQADRVVLAGARMLRSISGIQPIS
jgi:hypothetical protein